MKAKHYILIRITTLLLFWVAIANSSKAQIGFTNVSFTSQDTLQFGDTVFVNAQLYNYDTAVAFNGLVNFTARVNGAQTSSLLPDTATLSIPPKSGVSIFMRLPVSSPLFKVGPDVVIIWPYSTVPSRDTIRKTVWVRYPLALQDEKSNTFTAYIRGSTLKLDLGDSKEQVQRVRIYSLIGSVIYENAGRVPFEIPLQDHQPGIYMCEILWKNNTRKVVRFLLN